MNDDFLTRFRKAPPREFAVALYERINTPMVTHRKFSLKRFTFAMAVCLALAAAVLLTPNARAALQYFVWEIGGVTYLEEQVPSTPLPESQVTIVPDETLTLSEAQEKLPYEISLPTWSPEGFTMGTTVRVSYFGEKYTPVYITWYGSDPKVGNIDLIVGQRVGWLVDLEHLQEVEINGQPGGLTGGSWNADTGDWSGSDATLTWLRGDVMYILRSPGASAGDLIRMAESVP